MLEEQRMKERDQDKMREIGEKSLPNECEIK